MGESTSTHPTAVRVVGYPVLSGSRQDVDLAVLLNEWAAARRQVPEALFSERCAAVTLDHLARNGMTDPDRVDAIRAHDDAAGLLVERQDREQGCGRRVRHHLTRQVEHAWYVQDMAEMAAEEDARERQIERDIEDRIAVAGR